MSYLLVKHWLLNEKGVAMVDSIEKKHLLDLNNGMCEAIINLENMTYFDPESNSWVEVKK